MVCLLKNDLQKDSESVCRSFFLFAWNWAERSFYPPYSNNHPMNLWPGVLAVSRGHDLATNCSRKLTARPWIGPWRPQARDPELWPLVATITKPLAVVLPFLPPAFLLFLYSHLFIFFLFLSSGDFFLPVIPFPSPSMLLEQQITPNNFHFWHGRRSFTKSSKLIALIRLWRSGWHAKRWTSGGFGGYLATTRYLEIHNQWKSSPIFFVSHNRGFYQTLSPFHSIIDF